MHFTFPSGGSKDVVKFSPTGKPHCPNHGCALEDLGFPMRPKGTGTCPVSKATFDYSCEIDQDKMTKDKDGNMVKGTKWHVTGDE